MQNWSPHRRSEHPRVKLGSRGATWQVASLHKGASPRAQKICRPARRQHGFRCARSGARYTCSETLSRRDGDSSKSERRIKSLALSELRVLGCHLVPRIRLLSAVLCWQHRMNTNDLFVILLSSDCLAIPGMIINGISPLAPENTAEKHRGFAVSVVKNSHSGVLRRRVPR